MRARLLAVVATAAVALAFPPAVADTPPPKPTAEAPAPADWKNDPVCQMVFFAVLEGLYTDGIPDAVVDGIVPRQPKEGANPVKTSFVFQCPLCHPVYEAFAVYQKRPAFNDDAKRNTFGRGIDADLEKQLRDPAPMTRLKALHALVQRWVERRLNGMRLTPDELKDWQTRLGERSRQGRDKLSKLLSTDPNYRGWTIYWGCAACNATTGACATVKAATPAAKP